MMETGPVFETVCLKELKMMDAAQNISCTSCNNVYSHCHMNLRSHRSVCQLSSLYWLVVSSCKVSCMQLVKHKTVLYNNKISQHFPEIWYSWLHYCLKNYAVCEIRSRMAFWVFTNPSILNEGGVIGDVALCRWVNGAWQLEGTWGTSHPAMQHYSPKKLECNFELN